MAEDHLSQEHLAPQFLAARLGISYSRLRQLFRKELDISPAEYIRNRRLERARTLLASSTVPVKYIMVEAGFKDPSHFARNYKSKFGVSPSECIGCSERRNLSARQTAEDSGDNFTK
jgi:transcriptional regulator GlxA family with amidase domain